MMVHRRVKRLQDRYVLVDKDGVQLSGEFRFKKQVETLRDTLLKTNGGKTPLYIEDARKSVDFGSSRKAR